MIVLHLSKQFALVLMCLLSALKRATICARSDVFIKRIETGNLSLSDIYVKGIEIGFYRASLDFNSRRTFSCRARATGSAASVVLQVQDFVC